MRHGFAFAIVAALAWAPPVLAQTANAPSGVAVTQVYSVTPGSGPHDVAPGPDGLVWYSAQRQGALGILDPRTGAVRQVPLGPDSSPHGVIQGPDGAAWLTDSGQNAIVRVDPRTDEVKVWKLPADAGYTNLNTAVFDRDGLHWFTGQNGIYGRLDPKTGDMKVWKAPEGRGAYGIATTPDGNVYYVSLAGSHLARINKATGEATVIEPPTANQGARRVWSDSRGDLWVSEFNSGNLSRYTPASNQWATWRLPGERPRAYAVYVDDKDLVWVSDFGANATLSFDPRTERWASYPGTAPGANVRQILGRPGEVWLPESGTNRLMVIRTGPAS